ncbi:MAG: hypothetical protein IKE41_04845 [Clostridia bacterium]|nr:hypothetical protein [Clostridia bacterium]MBR2734926.1 hypothetical protein [Clostridia bacterium]
MNSSNQTKFIEALNVICSDIHTMALPNEIKDFYEACRIIVTHFEEIDKTNRY